MSQRILLFCVLNTLYVRSPKSLKATKAIFGLMRNLLARKYHGYFIAAQSWAVGYLHHDGDIKFESIYKNCQGAGEGRGVTEFDGQIMEMLLMTPS